jgi:hypothetical protein
MIESFGHSTQQQTLAHLGEILCHVMAIGLIVHFRTNPCGHPLWHAPQIQLSQLLQALSQRGL